MASKGRQSASICFTEEYANKHSDDECSDDPAPAKKVYTAYAQHLRKTVGRLLQLEIPKNKTQTLTIEHNQRNQSLFEDDCFE
jgi:hypothetical protein